MFPEDIGDKTLGYIMRSGFHTVLFKFVKTTFYHTDSNIQFVSNYFVRYPLGFERKYPGTLVNANFQSTLSRQFI